MYNDYVGVPDDALILRNLFLPNVMAGQRLLFTGIPGSGKTNIVKALMGKVVFKEDREQIRFDGRDSIVGAVDLDSIVSSEGVIDINQVKRLKPTTKIISGTGLNMFYTIRAFQRFQPINRVIVLHHSYENYRAVWKIRGTSNEIPSLKSQYLEMAEWSDEEIRKYHADYFILMLLSLYYTFLASVNVKSVGGTQISDANRELILKIITELEKHDEDDYAFLSSIENNFKLKDELLNFLAHKGIVVSSLTWSKFINLRSLKKGWTQTKSIAHV